MDLEDQAWLRPDEVVLYSGRQSLRRESLWALPNFFGAIFGVIAIRLFSDNVVSPVSMIALYALLLGFAVSVPHLLVMYRRFEVILTNQRLFHRRGLFRCRMEEFAVTDIARVDADRSGDFPFELILTDGRSKRIRNLPRMDRLRDGIALARREISDVASRSATPA